MTDLPTTGFDVPDDADDGQPPDANRVEERADYPDPAFDDVPESIEDPIEDEGDESDEPDLGPEDPALLEADEQVDPEAPDQVLPPEKEDEWT